ncbi:tRNA (guanine-N(7)-)-methyltransferase non-catalytic subunit wuho [Sitophilus oryzae]|uniref:tRNA (Guanine-N(7)-)-methyltransferase non-catalytic subunit wuho n=1 Tax=Sitophilus oryzae TaxID=7048 RepID=A0A6J2X9F9_SITOR|nr:tRNA (guanine-N(7)-)-methyltransferase non-catalytic subunit wuho [Sitophilus oryzae]
MVILYENNLLWCAFSRKLLVFHSSNEHEELEIPEPELPKESVKENNGKNITCITSSKDSEYTAITTQNKQLIVYNKVFKPIRNIKLPKVANKICFAPNNELLVADKNGDVWAYNVNIDNEKPVLLLGHLSIIIDMIISPCGKYIITCDRDEKIRVSHYPNSYNIAMFCLGHKEFVTQLHLLKNNVLLSASGDGTVRMWNYLEGKQLNMLDCNDRVEESILKKIVNELHKEEEIDISRLPVCNMQVQENDNNVILAISLYKIPKIYLYKLNSENLKCSYVNHIEVEKENFSFFLSSRLYIITDKVTGYNFNNNDVDLVACKLLDETISRYKDLLNHSTNCSTLFYKKKHNNIEDYLFRKKQRLESK